MLDYQATHQLLNTPLNNAISELVSSFSQPINDSNIYPSRAAC